MLPPTLEQVIDEILNEWTECYPACVSVEPATQPCVVVQLWHNMNCQVWMSNAREAQLSPVR